MSVTAFFARRMKAAGTVGADNRGVERRPGGIVSRVMSVLPEGRKAGRIAGLLLGGAMLAGCQTMGGYGSGPGITSGISEFFGEGGFPISDRVAIAQSMRYDNRNWFNPETGHRGSVQTPNVFRQGPASRELCGPFRADRRYDDRNARLAGTACMLPDGRVEILEGSQTTFSRTNRSNRTTLGHYLRPVTESQLDAMVRAAFGGVRTWGDRATGTGGTASLGTNYGNGCHEVRGNRARDARGNGGRSINFVGCREGNRLVVHGHTLQVR